MSEDNPHRYQPLDISKNEIRLLHLFPCDPANPAQIQLELRHCSLYDKPVYTALSYAWGDPTLLQHVLVNGKAFKVTVNLAAALSQLAKDKVEILWIDAICKSGINLVSTIGLQCFSRYQSV